MNTKPAFPLQIIIASILNQDLMQFEFGVIIFYWAHLTLRCWIWEIVRIPWPPPRRMNPACTGGYFGRDKEMSWPEFGNSGSQSSAILMKKKTYQGNDSSDILRLKLRWGWWICYQNFPPDFFLWATKLPSAIVSQTKHVRWRLFSLVKYSRADWLIFGRISSIIQSKNLLYSCTLFLKKGQDVLTYGDATT